MRLDRSKMLAYAWGLAVCVLCNNVFEAGATYGTPWATAEEEALDEVNDPQIFQAVVDSIREWQARHKNKTRLKRASNTVCYPDVGCFDEGGYLDLAPSAPQDVNTRFLLYTTGRGGRGARSENSLVTDLPFVNMSATANWDELPINASLKTKVIVHGFGSSCSHVWVYEMRSALMSVEDCNVVCVDWEGGATFPNYVRAAANTRLVGRQLSFLLESFSRKGLNMSQVHVIGFSLGAHAAAFAGASLNATPLARITGLDPAGPLFESQDPVDRLDSTDASFVDVIHSNGETLILGGLGSSQPMGHVDFYPNGGRMQKGCTNLFVGAVSDIIWSGAVLEARSLCNHRRAYKFFTDSVSAKCQFPAMPCHSYDAFLAGQCFPCPQGKGCPNMGYYADATKARGTLYLVTRDEEPFCAHQYLVKIESSPSSVPMTSYGKIQITLISDAQINETFTITTKDDEELSVGKAISKIIVPHPALEQFTAVALVYTAYSGWISSGLLQWGVSSVFLMDPLSNKWSVCEKEIVLESGVEAIFPLVQGECNETQTVDVNATLLSSSVRRNSTYKPTEVVFLGDEILEEDTNSTEPVKTTKKKKMAPKERHDVEIVDLKPPGLTADKTWLYWEGHDPNSSGRQSSTVQLLPKRLQAIIGGAVSSDRMPRRLLSWFTAPHAAPAESRYIPTYKAKPTKRNSS
ncbi:hypothetical protein GE061_007725 [Apolygus lucorum]|uniref:Lipase domain-containing protein n=1 Tax=Apolygus lucorum TaxID=248454 RepID=A0A8S9WLF1_APOLU|nr:hypothetical protein GE061_007725 [Apolygus lucorum]